MRKMNAGIYCRVGSEEQLNINPKDKPFMNINKYKPYKGFYDLREFDISDEMFRKLWKIQKYLYESSKNKEYLKEKNPIQWLELKKVSGEYQRILLIHNMKENRNKEQDIEEEIEK